MIPLFKTNKTQQPIKYTGPSIWNKISIEIRHLNLPKFKKEYKKRLRIYHKLIYLIRHAVNLEAGLMTVKYPIYLILNFYKLHNSDL